MIDFAIIPTATTAETTANPFCNSGPAIRDEISRPPSIPASAPAEKGGATAQFR